MNISEKPFIVAGDLFKMICEFMIDFLYFDKWGIEIKKKQLKGYTDVDHTFLLRMVN